MLRDAVGSGSGGDLGTGTGDGPLVLVEPLPAIGPLHHSRFTHGYGR